MRDTGKLLEWLKVESRTKASRLGRLGTLYGSLCESKQTYMNKYHAKNAGRLGHFFIPPLRVCAPTHAPAPAHESPIQRSVPSGRSVPSLTRGRFEGVAEILRAIQSETARTAFEKKVNPPTLETGA